MRKVGAGGGVAGGGEGEGEPAREGGVEGDVEEKGMCLSLAQKLAPFH